jgi:hypothetical protein
MAPSVLTLRPLIRSSDSPLDIFAAYYQRNPTVASTGLCARAITELCTEVKLPSGVSQGLRMKYRAEFAGGST